MSLSALLSSKDERDKLIVARTPKKTVQATDFWSRSFQKYALESKNVPDLLALSKEKIGEVLECYFLDVRTKGGDMYSRNSYVSAKAAIQRWLSASMTVNIFTDPEFKRANAVLDGLLKEKKRQGLEAPVKHKDAISDADWKKIELHFADVLTANDPRKLCQLWHHEFAVRERLSLQCWQRHVQQRDVQLCATAAEEEEGFSRKTTAEKDPRAAPPEQDSWRRIFNGRADDSGTLRLNIVIHKKKSCF